ncbi:Hypothetical predicted protein [Olea europaea subsp. europaea]|uniref:Uncharacterized protein n=1 Tax=Olea europaea subsp. europaea TaxID=158383 RepID=A0A8S0TC69_OLEEU|nr:Hypothetical predicted protein [Olea europaea subsp. europaea]
MGHVRDASWPRQGCSLISRHFYAIFGTRCTSHVKDTLGTQPDFQVFLGSFWDMVCRPCPVRVQAMTGTWPDFSGIFGQFQGTFMEHGVRTRLGQDGTQADFQAQEGNVVCRPSQGRRLVPRHSRKFLRHGVHAKSRTR